MEDSGNQPNLCPVATRVVATASTEERRALAAWARHMLEIRSSDLSILAKAMEGQRASLRSQLLVLLLRRVRAELVAAGVRLTRVWWQRGWATRLATVGAAFGLIAGGKAGLAAFGSGIGLPLWVVFGAGGSFVGTVLNEIERMKA